jgi:rhamnosyltransferase subunit B
MTHIAVATFGAGGDAFPFVGLALELASRRHEVTLCGGRELRTMTAGSRLRVVTADRITASKARPLIPFLYDDGDDGYAGLRELITRLVMPGLLEAAVQMQSVLDDAEALIAHPLCLHARLAAEVIGTRTLLMYLQPQMTPRHEPATKTESVAASLAPAVVLRQFSAEINAVRESLGLDARDDPILDPNDEAFVACSTVWSPPELQPPDGVVHTGFVSWDNPSFGSRDLGSLNEFLSDGESPVLVTLGTTLRHDGEEIYSSVSGAVQELGRRCIVLGGSAPSRSPDAIAVPYAPLSVIAPRCATMVHHCGIGSIRAGLIAGIPSLCIPRSLDQPWNAARMDAIGAGIVIPWRETTPTRVAAALSELDSLRYNRNASAIGVEVRREGDGAQNAADRIEQLLSADIASR